jgi:hypothetical protein
MTRIQDLTLVPKSITGDTEALRSMKGLTRIIGLPPSEFWRNYEAGEYR